MPETRHDDTTDDRPSDTHDIPAPPLGRFGTARGALVVIGVCVLVLLAFEGASIRNAGREMDDGWQRTLVLAVGDPAGWLSDASGLGAVKDRTLAWEKEREQTPVTGDEGVAGGGADGRPATGAVSPEAIDGRAIGDGTAKPPALRTLLVTGDSMSQPLDADIARSFARGGSDVRVVRDPRIGTGLSNSDVLDWIPASAQQVAKNRPQAVVVFLGANEGFPLRSAGREVQCCGVDWTAAYATRVRRMMNIYRQGGAARVYWLTLPAPRDRDRMEISRAVNTAIAAAAAPLLAQVRVVDLAAVFTPGWRFREAMEVDGREQIVREQDGIHLNDTGSVFAAQIVERELRSDFGAAVPDR